jgi:hypothetical protein
MNTGWENRIGKSGEANGDISKRPVERQRPIFRSTVCDFDRLLARFFIRKPAICPTIKTMMNSSQ